MRWVNLIRFYEYVGRNAKGGYLVSCWFSRVFMIGSGKYNCQWTLRLLNILDSVQRVYICCFVMEMSESETESLFSIAVTRDHWVERLAQLHIDCCRRYLARRWGKFVMGNWRQTVLAQQKIFSWIIYSFIELGSWTSYLYDPCFIVVHTVNI